MSGPLSTLALRRTLGLCSRCARKLMPHEKEMEGVGGSFVRCDRCVRELGGLPPDQWEVSYQDRTPDECDPAERPDVGG